MAYTEWYCNASTGSNLYAGSTTGAPLVTYTSGTWVNATRVFTVASGDPVADGVAVGDFVSVYADGASAPTGFVGRVTARTTTTITVSATVSAGTNPSDGTGNRTLVVGGVWAGPSGASGFPINFATSALVGTSGDPPRVNYKNNATYSITAAITCGTSQGNTTHQGYSSSPGDGGKATLDGGSAGASYILLTTSGTASHWLDWIFSNNGATGSAAGVSATQASMFERCVATGTRGSGFHTTSGTNYIECEAYSCNASNTANMGGFEQSLANSPMYLRCVSHNNSGTNNVGFFLRSGAGGGGPTLIGCVADTNGLHGFSTASPGIVRFINCTAYNNGVSATGSAIHMADSSGILYAENCIFDTATGYGVNRAAATTVIPTRVVNCGFRSLTAGDTNLVNASWVTGKVSFGTASMVDPANGNFTPLIASAQGTGRGAFQQTSGYTGTSTSYPDLGAVQTAGGQASAVFASAINLGRRYYQQQVTRRVTGFMPGSQVATNVYVPVRIDNPRARGRAATTHRRVPPQLIPLPAVITTLYVPVPMHQRVRVDKIPSRPPMVRPFPFTVVEVRNVPVPQQARQVTRFMRTLRREPTVIILPPPQTVIVSHPKVVR